MTSRRDYNRQVIETPQQYRDRILALSANEDPVTVLRTTAGRLRTLIVGSRRHQLDMVRALDAMSIKPVIDRTFKLEALADAFRYEASGKHFGKIAIEI